jgi:pyridoxal phosphate enzyme (YggS family)
MTDRAGDDAVGRRVRANVDAVRERMAAACEQAGRPPADVRLVAVTKYVDAAVARLVAAAGCADLAESRPQRLAEMAVALVDVRPEIRWHLVGHLQRNKVRKTLPFAPLVHTLDSLRLLDALEAEAAALGCVCESLVEVNLAGDPGRTGAGEAEAEQIVAAAAAMRHVRVCGLMGMASVPDGDRHAARREFARLRALRDRLAATLPGGDGLRELSMGMSGDFAEAILEGATLIRVGSALFEGIGT